MGKYVTKDLKTKSIKLGSSSVRLLMPATIGHPGRWVKSSSKWTLDKM